MFYEDKYIQSAYLKICKYIRIFRINLKFEKCKFVKCSVS